MNNVHRTKVQHTEQLKSWIKHTSGQIGIEENTILQNYFMERFLERISLSKYAENIILKGGFLITSMIGLNLRSTMDMDTTIKNLPVNEVEISKVINEIIDIPIDDKVSFVINSIKPIHDLSNHENFRVRLTATFLTIRVHMKIDITTGDEIIPKEIDYSFKLMFEMREINVKAYNLYTILAEKIESILSRNVFNTRARDFYDVYTLLKLKSNNLVKVDLINAILTKAKERNTDIYVTQKEKYLKDIRDSKDLREIWNQYTRKFKYASNISFEEVIKSLESIFVY